jgi:hypothetical protein
MATNEELEKGRKLLRDQSDEVGFLDNAFKSLAATISTTLEDAIDQMNGLDTITKKVAQSYQKDIAQSIKKTTSGLEETISLQLKIKQGVNVEADLKKKMDALEVRRIATLKKIMMAGKELGIDTMELKVQLKEQYDLELQQLEAMKKQNAETQKAKPLFQLLKENAGSIADKIDKSGTLSKVLSGGIKSVLTPMRLLELAIVGVFDSMVAVDKQNGELAKNLNINVSEAAALSSELSSAANKSGELSITTKGLGEALMAANGELGIFNTTIDDNLILFQKLHKTAGLTYEELSGIKSITDATGGDLEKNTKEVMAQARLTGQRLGVALNEKDILKDISNVSKATTLSLGKNPGQIANAVAAAKALGMELSNVEGIADSILNFESSIEKELEAELLLGKNINLEKARQAALNNDLATVAEEIAKQAGSAADFAKMNRIQQQALADAVGMSREDLASSLFVQEQIGNLTGEEYKLREKQIKELQAQGLSQDEIKAKLGKQSIEDLKNQNSVQENLNKSIAKAKEAFVSIAAPLMQIITPVVELLVPAFEMLSYLLVPISATFKGIASTIEYIVGSVQSIVGVFTGANEQLTVMQSLVGGIAIAYGAILTVQKLKAGYDILALAMAKRKNATEKKGLLISISDMAMTAFDSVAKIPFIGPALGIAAAVAAAALGYQYYNKADDMMSPGGGSGYGSRTLMGPEGAIALNNRDTVIAGTDLFGSNKQSSQPQTIVQQDNSESKKTNSLLEALINKPAPKVQMDSIEVGTVAGMSAFSIQ